jgi:hypothetical protein
MFRSIRFVLKVEQEVRERRRNSSFSTSPESLHQLSQLKG